MLAKVRHRTYPADLPLLHVQKRRWPPRRICRNCAALMVGHAVCCAGAFALPREAAQDHVGDRPELCQERARSMFGAAPEKEPKEIARDYAPRIDMLFDSCSCPSFSGFKWVALSLHVRFARVKFQSPSSTLHPRVGQVPHGRNLKRCSPALHLSLSLSLAFSLLHPPGATAAKGP